MRVCLLEYHVSDKDIYIFVDLAINVGPTA